MAMPEIASGSLGVRIPLLSDEECRVRRIEPNLGDFRCARQRRRSKGMQADLPTDCQSVSVFSMSLNWRGSRAVRLDYVHSSCRPAGLKHRTNASRDLGIL